MESLNFNRSQISMDSPVTFNFLSLQEGFIEKKCDGAARLHRRKKKTLFHTNVYYI